jgi:hypothetical protein
MSGSSHSVRTALFFHRRLLQPATPPQPGRDLGRGDRVRQDLRGRDRERDPGHPVSAPAGYRFRSLALLPISQSQITGLPAVAVIHDVDDRLVAYNQTFEARAAVLASGIPLRSCDVRLPPPSPDLPKRSHHRIAPRKQHHPTSPARPPRPLAPQEQAEASLQERCRRGRRSRGITRKASACSAASATRGRSPVPA